MCCAGASIFNRVNGLNRSGCLLFWNTGRVPVYAFEFGICAVGASWPLAITAGPTRMSDTELTEPGTEVDGDAAYFRRLQVSHAREILLRTLRLSPRGLSGSKLDAMRAADHGLGDQPWITVLRPDSGCLAVGVGVCSSSGGEDAMRDATRTDELRQLLPGALSSAVGCLAGADDRREWLDA